MVKVHICLKSPHLHPDSQLLHMQVLQSGRKGPPPCGIECTYGYYFLLCDF